jgi:ABC-type uncharacterized transport system ATPase component
MKIHEIITEGAVFARSGKGGAGGSASVKMKWRCDSGPRAGRIVSKPADCGGSIDVKKRAQMKKTRARTKVRQARRAKKTKKLNVASRIMQSLNKFHRRDLQKRANQKRRKPTEKIKKRATRPTRATRPSRKPKKFK